MSVALEITSGMTDSSSRLSLKRCMERFGEVVGCHIGKRGVDFPVVRYGSASHAEAALAALKAGEVFLDGMLLGGDNKGAQAPAKPPPRPTATSRDEAVMEITSRDLISRGGGRDGGGRDRRDRSRDRRRSRSRDRRRRDDSRSRSRRRRR
mmetsp:Transcript_24973/g.55182  ORF Transcript_24973/g.55182 Transcript_24973/m.55182 type:complete len:151 (-) Transcript_24973:87-539(-)